MKGSTSMTLCSRLLLIFALFSILPSALLHAQESGADLPEDVSQLLALTNQDRATQGLGPLRWSPELARAAQAHGELMVQHNDVQHQFAGEPDVSTRAGQAGAHFQAIAENIALGPNAIDIEKQWMHSAQHRTNILDPQMNIIGIALIHNNGEVWAVEDFAQRRGSSWPFRDRGPCDRPTGQAGNGGRDGDSRCAANLRDAAWVRRRIETPDSSCAGRGQT